MSILIKGMEMPKNCSDCPLNYDQMMCIVTGTRWWSDTMVLMNFDSDKERLHDCPLVELPPHGRCPLEEVPDQLTIRVDKEVFDKILDNLENIVMYGEGGDHAD